MNEILNLGPAVIYMKVGMHARENLESIIVRKREEYRRAGMIFWGYGGNTCHPTTLVQPFVKEEADKGHTVHLVMSPMDSRHSADPRLAAEYSDDGITWQPVPAGIRVVGSRYAMVLGDLRDADFDFDLQEAVVAVGPSRGRPGHEYIQGHVDKACFTLAPPPPMRIIPGRIKHIGLYAPLQPPYAVFLR